MTDTSHEHLTNLDKSYLWHPFTQQREWESSELVFIDSGEGVTLRDTQGREYYDANSSMWLNVHGHSRPEIDQAIITQLGKVAHSTMLGLTHAPGVELAERLVKIAPEGLSRVFYSDDGSTAIEIALKMAFQYWHNKGEDRTRYVALSDGYHGDTIGAVSVGGISLFHGIFRKLLFTADFVPSPALAHNADEAAEQLEHVLKAHPGEIFAVILEPLVQMAGGILIAPPEYLTRVRELCDQYDTLLICDEVATGFGRTGTMLACDHEQVTPDILCLGKGLTGGYLPLAATLATSKIYDAFLGEYEEWKLFTHGHSYTGNPLGCAAALANLDIFDSDQTIAKLQPKMAFLQSRLEQTLKLAHVSEIRQIGLIAGIVLTQNKSQVLAYPWQQAMGKRVCRRARDLGLITRPLGDVITFVPPLVSTIEELDAMVNILEEAIALETEHGSDTSAGN